MAAVLAGVALTVVDLLSAVVAREAGRAAALVAGHAVVAHLVGRARHAQAVVDVVLAVLKGGDSIGLLSCEKKCLKIV